MPPAAAGRLKPAPNTAAIRCYGQGLGDCFLLAFPRPGQPDAPYYVVIDCGVAAGTPDEEERMRRVVADIRAATGGHLAALALTHQHYDHVVGFVHAADLWADIRVDRLFLPWTERQDDPDAEAIGRAAMRLSGAAARAAERAARVAGAGGQTGLRLTGDLLAVGGESFGLTAAERIERGWANALARCPEEERRVYCEPGDVIALGDTGVKAHVLGPPRLKNRAGEDLLSRRGKALVYLLEDRREMYSYEQFGLAPDGPGHRAAFYANADDGDTAAVASALLAGGPGGDEAFDHACPFDPALQIGWDDALQLPFFRDHYAAGQDWRRIDDDWLAGAADMALRAGDFTNNISLVLGFELPQSRKVLLFVGDAQVGNWLSWHRIGGWHPLGEAVPSGRADMDDFLGRVAFYKVGHHGSHNATIRDKGLEKMPQGLRAFIPVSVPVAHDIMRYCPMPFYPLLLALQQKTGGAVFLANGELLRPLPPGADERVLEQGVRRSAATLPAKVRPGGTEIEGEVPLWIEFTLDD